jgi:hypothetical protein
MRALTTERGTIVSLNHDDKVIGLRLHDDRLLFLKACADLFVAAIDSKVGALVDVELITYPGWSIEDLPKSVEDGDEVVSGEALELFFVPSLTPDETMKAWRDWYQSIPEDDRKSISDQIAAGRDHE